MTGAFSGRAFGGMALAGLAVMAIAGPVPQNRPEPLTADRQFGAWSLVCGGPSRATCSLSQIVARDREGTQVVLGVVLRRLPGESRSSLEFRMSPDAVVQAGVGMKIGDGPEYRLPMSRCDAKACLASGWVEGDIRRDLLAAPAAQVAFMMPGRKQVLAPVALQGLAEGLAEVERIAAHAAPASPPNRRTP